MAFKFSYGYASLEKAHLLKYLSEYFEDKCSIAVIKGEYSTWIEIGSKIEEGTEVLTILEKCQRSFLPNIHHLLTVLATLPVTTITVERSFSIMKRTKTLIRNRTGNERMSGLALISLHWEVKVSPEKVLDIMAGRKSR
ncbi:hypothetical protein NQ314_004834 [Rhamnusium bicolor]|uniref:HAT C-terminal dimerisation domain-containing protein n=1 Tax=Rhamnusium bicolor TaxID=1586634 RepID=A0AAV8ZLA2_9CUCU|nr:hypothetical protein NQ314_004834 [Rhamnusium bicolor]